MPLLKAKTEIEFLSAKDKNFPASLLETPWPPKGIYIKGELEQNSRRIAIVGTRRATSYGKEIAFKIAEALARRQIVIVSGLALGIDAAGHAGALQGGGITWAVLGAGINKVGPLANVRLSENIVKEKGALISEYPPDFEGHKGTFPERNRIVAGLSELIIVIEAPEKSGALITARLALEAGREVAVIPGDVTRPSFAGSNRLLREGAHPILNAEDALYLLGINPEEKRTKFDKLDEISESILQCLGEPKNSDQIINEVCAAPALVSGKLIELEIAGILKQSGGVWIKVL
ncbi:DNA-protecting protein DprA [Candidatus Giovannonibacteria bacterium]|nr:DNA-protecting protein DprA [Candidatus Giovannonibacteria bacterium]